METYKLVMPEHLNHYGYLFGGNLLKWVDEYAYIAAIRDYPGHHFVTIAMDDVVFKCPIKQGTILRFDIARIHQGTTSLRYHIDVYRDNIDNGTEAQVFHTTVTFVNVDDDGHKHPLRQP